MSALRFTGSVARPADNTAYTAGDIVANSTTAGLVVPITFTPEGVVSGFITGARCIATPASSNLVITALDFDLLLFPNESSIPFAAAGYPADNTALTLTKAIYDRLIGAFRFSAGAWRNPLGALTASTVGYQAVDCGARRVFPFSLAQAPHASRSILGVVQILGAWTPTGIVNTFDFELDVDAD